MRCRMPCDHSAAGRSAPSRPVRTTPISPRELEVWALLMLLVAYWTNLVRIDSNGGSVSLGTIANSVINEGAFDLLAWVVVFENTSLLSKGRPACRGEILQTLFIGALCLIPTRQTVAVGMLVLALFFYTGHDASVFTRRISAILSALSFETVWTSPYLDFVHVTVGKFDAQIVAAIYRGLGHAASAYGNVVQNSANNFGITLVTQCSSSFILAGTGVAFLVTAFFRGESLNRYSIIWLCGCLIASVMLTELRLTLMARNEADYDWWHNGPGLSVYSLAATVSAVCFSIAATRNRGATKIAEAN